MGAFIGDYEFDLNGNAAGTAYTFTTNPTSGYVGYGTGVNSATGEFSTVDKFLLTFTPVPEPTATVLAVVSCIPRSAQAEISIFHPWANSSMVGSRFHPTTYTLAVISIRLRSNN